MSEIRALSIRQPWAWAVCAGLKKIENRTWTTIRRGTLAIHASTSMQVVNAIRQETGCKYFHKDHLPTGVILGLADLAEVTLYGPTHENDPFAEGPYCWAFQNARFLREPIELKGKLNLFKIDFAIQERLRNAETFRVNLQADAVASEIARVMTPEPDPIASYQELFQEVMATGNHSESLGVIGERLRRLAPHESTGYLATGYAALTKGQTDEATFYFKRAMKIDARNALGWLGLTDTYLRVGNFEAALGAANELIRRANEIGVAYQFRGRAYLGNGDYQAALGDFNKAIELAPDDVWNWSGRAETKQKLGDQQGAIVDIEQSIRLAPDDPTLQQMRKELMKH